MIAYDTATEDHVFQMINELYKGDGSSRDEVNQWLQGFWRFSNYLIFFQNYHQASKKRPMHGK